MRHAILIAATLLAAASSQARAADLFGQTIPAVDADVNVGTLGIGPEVNFHNPNALVGVRVGADFFQFNDTVKASGIDYKGKLNLASGGATVDLYPFHTGFRVSLGGLIDGNDVKLDARPFGTLTINGHQYDESQVGSLTGKATYDAVAPYAGVGYSFRVAEHVAVAFDVGAIYQGGGNLNLVSSGPIASNETFQQDLAAESGKVRHDLKYAQFYPVVAVSVGYHF
jgi:hypothetical protein